jgi:predicted TIM-barrel fold metal-dependent hydrolase
LFVACQTDDDLPYVLKYAGENCLMIGSDYGHADNASELLALARLKENGVIDPRVIDKILFTNPARFYGLD